MHNKNRDAPNYTEGMVDDTVFAKIRETMPEQLREIQLSAAEGALLKWLVRLAKARDILEIGTGVGYSTAWLISSMKANGKMLSIEKSLEYHQKAVQNIEAAGLDGSVDLVLGDAMTILPTLPDASFDLVFIDANKQGYPEYFKQADRLLRAGGLIIIDDILLYEGTAIIPRTSKMAAAITKTRDMACSHPDYHSVILPTPHGMLLAYKHKAD